MKYGSTSASIAIVALPVRDAELELDSLLEALDDPLLEAEEDPEEVTSLVLLCELLSFDLLELFWSSGFGSGSDGSTGLGFPEGSTVKGHLTPGMLNSIPPGGLILGG